MTAPQVGGGLCSLCRHCQPVHTTRGSTFLLCARAATDPTYVRYPRLPVLDCHGFALVTDGAGARSTVSGATEPFPTR